QSVLLAALRRHAGRLPAIGALFDLLTDDGALASISPLAQPMLSFLAEEVRDRRTLDLTCASLPAVAGRIGLRSTRPARPAPGAARRHRRGGGLPAPLRGPHLRRPAPRPPRRPRRPAHLDRERRPLPLPDPPGVRLRRLGRPPGQHPEPAGPPAAALHRDHL